MIDELNGDFLQWLRGFYYVAKTGSVRKAAEVMNRNPSTISYQLRSLEEELGTVLFDRYKKTLRITPEGRSLLDWTISTFETLQGMRSAVGNSGGDLRGHVHMAASLPMVTMCTCAISAFARRNPHVNVVIDRGLPGDICKAVRESEVDFGLLPVVSEPEGDKFETLLTARPILVARRHNPWQIPPQPQIDDLKRLPFVSFVSKPLPSDMESNASYVKISQCVRKNSVIQVNNYHLILRFVWNMLGVAVMDELCYQASNFGADWEDMAIIRLDHLLPDMRYGILVRRHKHMSPQALAFISALRGYFSSIAGAGDADAWRRIRHCDGKD